MGVVNSRRRCTCCCETVGHIVDAERRTPGMHRVSRRKGENRRQKTSARLTGCHPWNCLHHMVSRGDIHQDHRPEPSSQTLPPLQGLPEMPIELFSLRRLFQIRVEAPPCIARPGGIPLQNQSYECGCKLVIENRSDCTAESSMLPCLRKLPGWLALNSSATTYSGAAAILWTTRAPSSNLSRPGPKFSFSQVGPVHID